MRHFAEELELLKQALLEMGALVESSIHTAVGVPLFRGTTAWPAASWRMRSLINKMELDLDARVTRLLALNQPVAGDFAPSGDVSQNQHRPGAYGRPRPERRAACHLFKQTLRRQAAAVGQSLIETPRMAALVEDMLHRTLDAFVKRDADLASTILPADDDVDRLRDLVYNELIGIMQRDPTLVDAAVHLMFISRSLERIATIATNIAEDVIYLVRGIDVRHHAAEEI
ncbi:MAG: PhoU domain-containing protein [Acidobacteriota bacterium]